MDSPGAYSSEYQQQQKHVFDQKPVENLWHILLPRRKYYVLLNSFRL